VHRAIRLRYGAFSWADYHSVYEETDLRTRRSLLASMSSRQMNSRSNRDSSESGRLMLRVTDCAPHVRCCQSPLSQVSSSSTRLRGYQEQRDSSVDVGAAVV
jgi:hypothetical protein